MPLNNCDTINHFNDDKLWPGEIRSIHHCAKKKWKITNTIMFSFCQSIYEIFVRADETTVLGRLINLNR